MSGITLSLPGMAAEESPDSGTATMTTEAILAQTTQAIEQIEQLSPEELQQVESFAAKIELHSSLTILRYGDSVQRKLKGFTEGTLKSVAARDIGEVGELLLEMRNAIQKLNSESPTGKFLGVFRSTKKPDELRAKYTEVSKAMERIKRELDGWRAKLLVDVKTLDGMYQQILDYHKELTMYIRAGERKLAAARSVELEQLRRKAGATRAQEDVLMVSDFENKCNSFADRLHDLSLTKTISLQTAIQIVLVQNVNRQLALKIQSSTNNSIPAWQQSIAVALATQHSRQALELSNSELLAVIDEALDLQKEGCKTKAEISANSNWQTS